MAEQRVIVVPDVAGDDRFTEDFGFVTHSVMCTPVMGTTGTPHGAIVCVNKLPEQTAATSRGVGVKGAGGGRAC